MSDSPNTTTLAMAPLHGMRVLLIEDCGTIGFAGALNLMRFVRRALGAATVELKASAAQAQKRLQATPIDLCLIDYDLGAGPTGVDLARWMAAQPPLAAIWRVLWSATPIERIALTELPPLFHLVLPKDSTPAQLRVALTDLLRPAARSQKEADSCLSTIFVAPS